MCGVECIPLSTPGFCPSTTAFCTRLWRSSAVNLPQPSYGLSLRRPLTDSSSIALIPNVQDMS